MLCTILHGPTLDEPGRLASTLINRQTGRFDFYRVNPPLVEVMAGVPVWVAGYEGRLPVYNPPGRRNEFEAGATLVKANGERVLWLCTLARWPAVFFTLVGGVICYFWAKELSGNAGALLCLALWCFSPNIIAHGSVLTCDMACAATAVAACYVFWRWLRQPDWLGALLAGCVLGMAELTKFTNLLLFVLLPVLWLSWRVGDAFRSAGGSPAQSGDVQAGGVHYKLQAGCLHHEKVQAGCLHYEVVQIALMLFLAVVVINLGYGFEDSFKRLGDFRFVSNVFAGGMREEGTELGNRFRGTWLGAVPVPVPANYLQGIDAQRRDFEAERLSYLRGEFRRHGWWYYYLYAFAVKVPCGTLLLIVLAVFWSLWCGIGFGWRNELALLLPIAAYTALVSSQTGMNHHFRYVLPVFPFVFIWVSRLGVFFGAARGLASGSDGEEAKPQAAEKWKRRLMAALILTALGWSIYSSLRVFPHSLSYFNELAGGPENGAAHLLDSNIDWGQDLTYLKKWADNHPEAKPIRLAYFGLFDPRDIYPEFENLKSDEPAPGWYAVSVNYLHGWGPGGRPAPVNCTWLRQLQPAGRAGYSIYVYHVTREQANRLRRNVGLPAIQ